MREDGISARLSLKIDSVESRNDDLPPAISASRHSVRKRLRSIRSLLDFFVVSANEMFQNPRRPKFIRWMDTIGFVYIPWVGCTEDFSVNHRAGMDN